MRPRATSLLAGVLIALLPGLAWGQPARPLTVTAVGGLLGQMEGFCEDPGGPYDWPPAFTRKESEGQTALVDCSPKPNGTRGSRWLGGVLGVHRHLTAPGALRGDVLVVAGNNQPAAFGPSEFWNRVADLRPDAVAMGSEDFLRAVRGFVGGARRIHDFVRSSPRLPLLASNVGIRRHEDDINSIEFEHDSYEWHLDPDRTIGWTESIRIEHPADAMPTAVLYEFDGDVPHEGEAGRVVEVNFKRGILGADGTVSFPQGLRPGKVYRVVVSEGSFPKAIVRLRSDDALTPAAGQTGVLSGFPAIQHRDLLIVALVDPDTATGAGGGAWKWTDGSVRQLVFYEPQPVLAAMIERVTAAGKGSGTGKRILPIPPAILMLSDLDDPRNLKVLGSTPEVRFAIVHPESRLLGLAARSGDLSADRDSEQTTRFSGDLGFAAVQDTQYPRATRVLMRPEWFGETLVSATGSIVRDADDGAWNLSDVSATVTLVPGYALVPSVDHGVVTYHARFDNQFEQIETAAVYYDCPKAAEGVCRNFHDLWKNPRELLAVAGDGLRYRTKVDLAILSTSVIDEDYSEWVSRELDRDNSSSGWLTRYILDRLIYRSHRMVKVDVRGSDLLGALEKALKQDATLCVVGLDAGCPTKLVIDHPERVRTAGRHIQPGIRYRLLVPDSLADALALRHDEEAVTYDLIEALHQHLASGRWLPRAGDGPLASRLESRHANRLWSFLDVSTLNGGFSWVDVRDPEGRSSVRQNLGVEFAGAKEVMTFSVAAEADIAWLDAPRWGLYSPSSIKIVERREDGRHRTYDPDEFSTGIRLVWKLGVTRWYGGYFWDGQVLTHTHALTASRPLHDDAREGFKRSEVAHFTTLYDTPPRRFRGSGLGVDLLKLPKVVLGSRVTASMDRVGARWTMGRQTNLPIGVHIDDVVYSIDRLRSEGASALLNEYFADNPETFTRETRFSIVPGDARQQRGEGDLEGAVTLKLWKKTFTLTEKARYRRYKLPERDRSPFQLTDEWRLETRLDIPVVSRVKLMPTYVFHRANIADDANDKFYYQRFEMNLAVPLSWHRRW